MDEKETTKETKEEKKEETQVVEKTDGKDADDGGAKTTLSPIDKAQKVIDRMEEANKKAEEINAERQDIIAKDMLDGRAEAGTARIAKKELTDIEYAEEVEKGNINPFVVKE